MINRDKIEQTESLEEAIELAFEVKVTGRTSLLAQEAMGGAVAAEYNQLGKEHRYRTYQKLAADVWSRFGTDNRGTLLDIGCGSGLLSWELATGYKVMTGSTSKIIGIDLSEDMIALARKNQRLKVQSGEEGNIEFRRGNVYDLHSMVADEAINSIVCRNSLHRFTNSVKALQEMYNILQPGGKIYLRDLRRDADWKTIVERIGDERWKHPLLVQDYLAAMAAMLTIPELEQLLGAIGITKYALSDGSYQGDVLHHFRNTNEYEAETEYVLIITK